MSDVRPLISHHCNTWLLASDIDCKCLDASLKNDLRVGSGGNWTPCPLLRIELQRLILGIPRQLSTDVHTDPNFMGINLISYKECG